MAMKTMRLEDVRNKILESNGKIFRVEFIKRETGDVRTMVCRIGVKKDLKGVGLGYDPFSKGLIGVYDMQFGGYRMINLDGVLSIQVAGEEKLVEQFVK